MMAECKYFLIRTFHMTEFLKVTNIVSKTQTPIHISIFIYLYLQEK